MSGYGLVFASEHLLSKRGARNKLDRRCVRNQDQGQHCFNSIGWQRRAGPLSAWTFVLEECRLGLFGGVRQGPPSLLLFETILSQANLILVIFRDPRLVPPGTISYILIVHFHPTAVVVVVVNVNQTHPLIIPLQNAPASHKSSLIFGAHQSSHDKHGRLLVHGDP